MMVVAVRRCLALGRHLNMASSSHKRLAHRNPLRRSQLRRDLR